MAALKEFYGASIGVSGERQKFLGLIQDESESIASWETRVRNQGAQCEYELMRDQFIAGLASETLRVKLIGQQLRRIVVMGIAIGAVTPITIAPTVT